MADELSDELWTAHEAWLQSRPYRQWWRDWWTTEDWNQARGLADVAWALNPSGLYLYDAERAIREVGFQRAHRILRGQADVWAGLL